MDFAPRIAAAAGDCTALLALAIELSAALSGTEAEVELLRAADQTRREKQASRVRKHRVSSMDSVTLRNVTERYVTDPPSPLPSPSFPTPHITPSFPPPSQLLQPSSAEQALFALVPESEEHILAFLDGMPPTKRLGWVTVLRWVVEEGPRLTGGELRQAIGDFCAKVDRERWTPSYFRGFCREVRAGEGESGDAGKAFAAIRGLISVNTPIGRAAIRFIPHVKVEELGHRTVTAYDQVGGADRFLDQGEKIGFLLRDFTAAYASVPSQPMAIGRSA